MTPGQFPPAVTCRLEGWDLFWAELTVDGPAKGLKAGREAAGDRLAEQLQGRPLGEHPAVKAVRGLFRAAGCDPTRYRPSSEALARRVLKGEPLPAILPAVDINNLFSLSLLVPACVVDPDRLGGALTLRAGAPGETMLSMRGPFNLEGKPLLEDDQGPFGTPITDSERVKITTFEGTFWLVAYLPAGVVPPAAARRALAELARCSGGARARV